MRGLANATLKLRGYSVNTTDPKQIKEAEDLLLEQKPLVRAYTSDTYDVGEAIKYYEQLYSKVK